MDKRLTVRYPVNCPTVSCWVNPEGRRQTGLGISRDISVGGIFVIAQACPPVGTRVALNIAIPNLEGTTHGLHVTATGQVTRIEPMDGNLSGFAAAMRFDPIVGEQDGSEPAPRSSEPKPTKKE